MVKNLQFKLFFQSRLASIFHMLKKYNISKILTKTSMQIQKHPKLNTASFLKWIRTRYTNKNRKNQQYLYFPQQLVKQTSIQKIFVQFDADGSGGLSRDQVFDMFNSYGIHITLADLDELYDSVQVNLQELDCTRFKRCALSEKSNAVFRRIVAKLGEGYFPHNFTNMIIYIVFLSKREQLRKSMLQANQKIDNKVANMQRILKLNDLALNNQRLAIHTQNYKQNLRNSLRDIWQKVNQKYGQKFPYAHKIEQQFYQFCLKNCLAKQK